MNIELMYNNDISKNKIIISTTLPEMDKASSEQSDQSDQILTRFLPDSD